MLVHVRPPSLFSFPLVLHVPSWDHVCHLLSSIRLSLLAFLLPCHIPLHLLILDTQSRNVTFVLDSISSMIEVLDQSTRQIFHCHLFWKLVCQFGKSGPKQRHYHIDGENSTYLCVTPDRSLTYKKLDGYPASLGFPVIAPNLKGKGRFVNGWFVNILPPLKFPSLPCSHSFSLNPSSTHFLPPLFPSRRPCLVRSFPRSFPSSTLPLTLPSFTGAPSLPPSLPPSLHPSLPYLPPSPPSLPPLPPSALTTRPPRPPPSNSM